MSQCKYKVNDRIRAKALHVTSEAECSRRFGSNFKAKLLNGQVISVENKPTKTGRISWHVRAKYDLGGGTSKVTTLNVRSVKALPVESNGSVSGGEGISSGEGQSSTETQ